MPTSTASKRPVVTTEQQVKQAEANTRRNITRAVRSGVVGYLIFSPLYGKTNDKGLDLGGTIGLAPLAVHRHNVTDKTLPLGYRVEDGGIIAMTNGKGFTTNKVWADYVKENWGRDGYTVTEVRENGDYGPLGNIPARQLRAEAIVAGSFKPGQYDDDDDELDEQHPDTPKIMV